MAELKKATDEIWSSHGSVENWCAICRAFNDYLRILCYQRREDPRTDECVRKIVGYLCEAPKRVPRLSELSEAEWDRVFYYSAAEIESMKRTVALPKTRVREYALMVRGDFSGKLESFFSTMAVDRLFVRVDERYTFNPEFFRDLMDIFPDGVLTPSSDFAGGALPEVEVSADERSARALEELVEYSRISAGCAQAQLSELYADGQVKKRIGTPGEIAQEDEALRRIGPDPKETNVKGVCAQVIRETALVYRDGYRNNPKDVTRCYNRVYALLNPLRRRKTSPATRGDLV